MDGAGDATFWLAVLGGIGTFITILGGLYLKLSDSRHSKDAATHGVTVKELLDQIENLERQSALYLEQRDRAISLNVRCAEKAARMEEKIISLQDKLEANNIPYRPWIPRDDSSGDISALP